MRDGRRAAVQETKRVSQLKIRSLPALSASMPMWDVLQLFKAGGAHMAVLCEAPERTPPPPPALLLRCPGRFRPHACMHATPGTRRSTPSLALPVPLLRTTEHP